MKNLKSYNVFYMTQFGMGLMEIKAESHENAFIKGKYNLSEMLDFLSAMCE